MRQQKQREKETEQARSTQALPPLEQIVALLAEIIRRPQNTPRQWARRLARQGVRIATGDIQAVLDDYREGKATVRVGTMRSCSGANAYS